MSHIRTLRAFTIGSAFPLLEYSRQAKYIPYATEHFLEARGTSTRPSSMLDSAFHSSHDIAKIPHLRAHKFYKEKRK